LWNVLQNKKEIKKKKRLIIYLLNFIQYGLLIVLNKKNKKINLVNVVLKYLYTNCSN